MEKLIERHKAEINKEIAPLTIGPNNNSAKSCALITQEVSVKFRNWCNEEGWKSIMSMNINYKKGTMLAPTDEELFLIFLKETEI